MANMAISSRQTLWGEMEARRGELGLTQQELVELASISVVGYRYMGKDGHTIRDTTMSGVEDALQWERGSVQAILDGGKATLRRPQATKTPAEQQSAQPTEIRAAARMLIAQVDDFAAWESTWNEYKQNFSPEAMAEIRSAYNAMLVQLQQRQA